MIPPAHSPLSWSNLGVGLAAALGARVDAAVRLERLLSSEYGADRSILVDSGKHALQLGLRSAFSATGHAGIVALPAYSCFDVATAAAGAGARITLYDVDPATLAPEPASFRRALEDGARVAVVTPLYGIPVDWDAIERSATDLGAVVIEDAAQGQGATWHDRPLGSEGKLSVLSFGRGKGWTGGLGGALLLRRGAVAWLDGLGPETGRAPGAFGTLARAAAQWLLGRPGLYAIPASVPWLHLGETLYEAPTPPREISRVAAALLEESHALLARESEVRRATARVLDEALSGVPGLRPVRPPARGRAGYLRYPVLVLRGVEGLIERPEARKLGIARGYPLTLADLPAVRERLVSTARSPIFPGADELRRTLITLPTHSLVSSRKRATALALLLAYAT